MRKALFQGRDVVPALSYRLARIYIIQKDVERLRNDVIISFLRSGQPLTTCFTNAASLALLVGDHVRQDGVMTVACGTGLRTLDLVIV